LGELRRLWLRLPKTFEARVLQHLVLEVRGAEGRGRLSRGGAMRRCGALPVGRFEAAPTPATAQQLQRALDGPRGGILSGLAALGGLLFKSAPARRLSCGIFAVRPVRAVWTLWVAGTDGSDATGRLRPEGDRAAAGGGGTRLGH